MLRPAIIATTAVLAALATASTPVGTWNGKLNLKIPPMPANMPAAQKAQATKMIAQMKSGKIVLTFKADKTYTATSVGLPFNQTSGGTWSQKGNVVTTVAKRAGANPMTLTFSKDGKTMTSILPKGQGKVVFTK